MLHAVVSSVDLLYSVLLLVVDGVYIAVKHVVIELHFIGLESVFGVVIVKTRRESHHSGHSHSHGKISC